VLTSPVFEQAPRKAENPKTNDKAIIFRDLSVIVVLPSGCIARNLMFRSFILS
jgi:hypothetical protein